MAEVQDVGVGAGARANFKLAADAVCRNPRLTRNMVVLRPDHVTRIAQAARADFLLGDAEVRYQVRVLLRGAEGQEARLFVEIELLEAYRGIEVVACRCAARVKNVQQADVLARRKRDVTGTDDRRGVAVERVVYFGGRAPRADPVEVGHEAIGLVRRLAGGSD